MSDLSSKEKIMLFDLGWKNIHDTQTDWIEELDEKQRMKFQGDRTRVRVDLMRHQCQTYAIDLYDQCLRLKSILDAAGFEDEELNTLLTECQRR